MDTLKNYIDEALETTGYRIEGMTPLESKFFREKIFDKFSLKKPFKPLWENLNNDSIDIRESGSWKWLDEFLQLDEFYFFFDRDDDPIVYIFPENQSLAKFLKEFPVSVFYLTNKNLDYLLSYNDSDYLSALGTAEPWLRNKVEELSKTGWVDMDGKSYL